VKNLPFLHGELPTELKTAKREHEAAGGAQVGAGFEENSASPIWGPVDGPRHRRDWCAPPGAPPLVMGRYWFIVVTNQGQGLPTPEADRWAITPQSAFEPQKRGKAAFPSSKAPEASELQQGVRPDPG